MTKANEIAILRLAIEQLGPDSYCGPWLASVVEEVEATIRSDYFPTVTMAESRKACADIVEVAKADAVKITDRAQRYQSCVAESLRLALRNLTAV